MDILKLIRLNKAIFCILMMVLDFVFICTVFPSSSLLSCQQSHYPILNTYVYDSISPLLN